LIVGSTTYNYGALFAVLLVKPDHLVEGEVADDVGVEDEEWLIVAGLKMGESQNKKMPESLQRLKAVWAEFSIARFGQIKHGRI
jgi:hypothetical protein